jgi:hypothetical protein
MTDNHQPPTPEEMGQHLDDEIKETVQDWAANPQGTDYENLDERVDQKLRKTIAGWVGADEAADWKAIGGQMDAKTRASMAKWVGAEEGSDWPTITSRIENRVRTNVARMVKAERPAPESEEASSADASWGDIGTKIERDVRGWVGTVVGTEKDSDWPAIGNRLFDHVRTAFDKVVTAAKEVRKDPPAPTERIEIKSEDESPAVKSSTPVDPE